MCASSSRSRTRWRTSRCTSGPTAASSSAWSARFCSCSRTLVLVSAISSREARTLQCSAELCSQVPRAAPRLAHGRARRERRRGLRAARLPGTDRALHPPARSLALTHSDSDSVLSYWAPVLRCSSLALLLCPALTRTRSVRRR